MTDNTGQAAPTTGAASPRLYRLPYRGHFTVTGRGTAYSFLPDDLPAELAHPRELVGSEIMVDQVRVRVTAVEHFAIVCPRPEIGVDRCEHPFALLVQP